MNKLLQPNELVDHAIILFDQYIADLAKKSAGTDFNESYYLKHRDRFKATLALLPTAEGTGASVLELGATDFFQVVLRYIFGYSKVYGTQFSSRIEEKLYQKELSICDFSSTNLTFSVNLEQELLPIPDSTIDTVMCCEVLEHMDIDPMFMLSELNRVCKIGGSLVLTTPNCCSARNFWKIAQGHRPHFFMQYELSRSPYRHNIEWDVHAVAQLSRAAGFDPVILETMDVFEAPVPQAISFLKKHNLETAHRGDGIFLLAKKVSPVVDRWPVGIYV